MAPSSNYILFINYKTTTTIIIIYISNWKIKQFILNI